MNQSRVIRTVSLLAILVVFVIVIYGIVPQYVNNLNTPFSTPSSTPTPSLTPRTLTPEEQAVLKIPLQYASSEEKAQHTKQVAKLAATAPTLDITACRPTPLAYQANLNGSFTVTNNDEMSHTLRYMSYQILVPAQSSTTVKTSQLFKTPGDYGYGCDNPFAKHGLLVVR